MTAKSFWTSCLLVLESFIHLVFERFVVPLSPTSFILEAGSPGIALTHTITPSAATGHCVDCLPFCSVEPLTRIDALIRFFPLGLPSIFSEIICQALTRSSVLNRDKRFSCHLDFIIASQRASLNSAPSKKACIGVHSNSKDAVVDVRTA